MIEVTPKPGHNRSKRSAGRRRPGTWVVATASLGVLAGLLLGPDAAAVVKPRPTPTSSPSTPISLSPAASSPAATGGEAVQLPAAPPGPPVPGGVPMGGPRMAEQGVVIDPLAGAPPDVYAPSWVIADANTGQVLAARNPHGRARPASTQKVLLALTMLPRLDPNGSYTADHSDEAVEGTRVGMVASQTYKIDDLWYAVFLRSGNDAADGIAKAGGGDLGKAVTMMQAEAARLQAYDTTVVNPNGLDVDGQYSSAYDLALMGRAALRRADVRQYAGTRLGQFPGNETSTATKANSKPFQIQTENKLLGKYPGATGLKPGYTTLAQNTLIATAERNGTTLVATIMYDSHGRIVPDAEALLDWGFANDGKVRPVGVLVDPTSPAPGETAAPAPAPDTATVAKHSSGGHGLRLSGFGRHWREAAGSALFVGLTSALVVLRLRVRRRYRRFGAYR